MLKAICVAMLMLAIQPVWAYKIIGIKDGIDGQSVIYVVRCDNQSMVEVKSNDDGSFYNGKHYPGPRKAIKKACDE